MNIAFAIEGTLMAQLTQNCINGIIQRNQTLTDSKTETHKITDTKRNLGLQKQALTTLQLLIRGVPSSESWKALLPGTFSVRLFHKNDAIQ